MCLTAPNRRRVKTSTMGDRYSAQPCSVTLFLIEFVLLGLVFAALPRISGTTDASDVQALQVMYTSVNSPSQLTNWKSSGGDPCGESWKGVTCEGTAVVAIEVSGLGLSGTTGYLLSDLLSLKKFDLSDNNFHDTIPYQLPPNLTSLNLARNNFSGNFPYSISTMVSLNYLNVSHNSLSESIGDIFATLGSLATLDLSLNNFSGDIPASFSSLSNLSALYVQNNQLTGSLNALTGLPLTTLNVANNHFSGWIPRELSSVHTFIYDGNSFDNGPAPPPPPYNPPPPGRPSRNHSGPGTRPQRTDGKSSESKKGLTVGALVGIIAGSVFVALILLLALFFCIRKNKREGSVARPSRGGLSVGTNNVNTEMQEQRFKSASAVTDLKPPPAEILVVDRLHGKNGSIKRIKSPITATPYTVATLQTATNSFSQEFLVGEGSLGRVYRAEFPNGKMMAIKKIDNAALSLQEEDNFLEAVSNMSRLRHPNIVTLVGYCAEHGQRLLVYEYIGNGSLHDVLHFAEDGTNTLTWNARVRVALGTARALEYLHEVCLPSVVHRNFKSANILLDEELNAHLSDCGLAALTPNTERQVSTQMVGSFGYSAPEFALSGVYTVKSDVYSFGVVMLELLTGRKPLDSSRARSEQSLVRWATPQLHDIDALAKMVDPSLNGMYPAKSLSRFADIIALCVQPEPEFRPPMSEVVQALVRLVQRASMVKRRSSDESGFAYRTPDHEAIDMSF
ncbi:protein STRUBBELIG-RECEPTOR FAMILY 8 [Rosa sericea]